MKWIELVQDMIYVGLCDDGDWSSCSVKVVLEL
jgi:hypothetical protein